jgi:SAM-dependent methyltransferase
MKTQEKTSTQKATADSRRPDDESLRAHIRSRYAGVATAGASGCCTPGMSSDHRLGAKGDERSEVSACCGGGTKTASDAPSNDEAAASCPGEAVCTHYDSETLAGLPEGADLGLGCGNPTALGSLDPGEVVLDLGSGGGIDCFLAARAVGPKGKVIGVDMTPEMIARARRVASTGEFANVEFRLGEIEHLPVADQSVDVVISNCVINLVPDKAAVFREVGRVLRPGGRAYLSDIALVAPLPEAVRNNPDAVAGCIGGAILIDDYRRIVIDSGLAIERFEVRGAEASRRAAEGTPSPDPWVAESLSASGSAIELLRSLDIVARKP